MHHLDETHDVCLIELIQEKFPLLGNKVKYAYVTIVWEHCSESREQKTAQS
jgi:hypothetical protein